MTQCFFHQHRKPDLFKIIEQQRLLPVNTAMKPTTSPSRRPTLQYVRRRAAWVATYIAGSRLDPSSGFQSSAFGDQHIHLPHRERPQDEPPISPTPQLPGLVRASHSAEKSLNPTQRTAAFAKKRSACGSAAGPPASQHATGSWRCACARHRTCV